MPSEPTVLDVLEGNFEQSVGPELIAAVKDASYPRLRELQESVRAFGEAAAVPSKRGGQLRPYVPLERDEMPGAPSGLYLRADDFADPRNAEIAFDALRHHLVYCDSLAIDNPLRWMLDAFLVKPAPHMTDYLERQRRKVLNYLQFLTRIEPMVRADVIVLVESDLGIPPNLSGALSDTTAVADAADFSDLQAENLVMIEKNETLGRWALTSHANHQLATSLEAMKTHSGALDLYFPYRHYEDLLRAVIEEDRQELPERIRGVELGVLSDVLKLSLPGLKELKPQEIVAMRQGEAAFAQWRRSLERGMERVRNLDGDALAGDGDERSEIEKELVEGREKLEAEIKKSTFLSHAKRGWRDFSIGSIVALGMTPLTGPGPAMAGGAGQAGLRLILDLFAGRKTRDTAQALHHQYLLFSPGSPMGLSRGTGFSS